MQKIISLRNDILAGKHPQFATSDNSWIPPTNAPGTNSSHIVAARPPPQKPQQTEPAAQQIDSVLLGKSDIVLKAEAKLRRQNLEQRIRRELERKKGDSRTGVEIKDGYARAEPDVDLESAMEEAGIVLKPVVRPDDQTSVAKLKEFYGKEEPEREREREKDKEVLYGGRGREGREDVYTEGYVPPPLASTPQVAPPIQARPPVQQSLRSPRVQERTAPAAEPRDTRPQVPGNGFRMSAVMQMDRVDSPQPQYSATNNVRSPAAPQPRRPANMARVESQDQIIEVNDDVPEFVASPRRRPSPPPTALAVQRSRPSPGPPIKQEPTDSPFRREEYPGRRGAQSPSRGYPTRPGSPSEFYRREPIRDPRYYGPPGPPPPRHIYEGYAYPEDPYAYPPHHPDFRRFPPPYERSPFYPPPRTGYEEYDPYGRPLPPPRLIRPASPRRSASPPTAYRRPRRDSRSPSPDRRRPSPIGSNTSRQPAEFPRERAEPPLPIRASEQTYPPAAYPIPREHRPPYYELRDPYYPQPIPPVPRFGPPRAESAMVPREPYDRGYRERDYPPPLAMQPPAYPPRSEYLRGPGPPPPEYYGRPEDGYPPAPYVQRMGSVRPPPEGEYYRAQSVRPGERDGYERSTSAMPGGYMHYQEPPHGQGEGYY